MTGPPVRRSRRPHVRRRHARSRSVVPPCAAASPSTWSSRPKSARMYGLPGAPAESPGHLRRRNPQLGPRQVQRVDGRSRATALPLGSRQPADSAATWARPHAMTRAALVDQLGAVRRLLPRRGDDPQRAVVGPFPPIPVERAAAIEEGTGLGPRRPARRPVSGRRHGDGSPRRTLTTRGPGFLGPSNASPATAPPSALMHKQLVTVDQASGTPATWRCPRLSLTAMARCPGSSIWRSTPTTRSGRSCPCTVVSHGWSHPPKVPGASRS